MLDLYPRVSQYKHNQFHQKYWSILKTTQPCAAYKIYTSNINKKAESKRKLYIITYKTTTIQNKTIAVIVTQNKL